MRFFISSRLKTEEKEKLLIRGIEAVAIPLITTKPVGFDTEKAVNFNPNYIIISSKNGVTHFFSKLPPTNFKNSKFIAVGKVTAKLLKEKGIDPLIPENYSGEGLIELLKTLDIKGKKFLLVKPKVARNVIKEFLLKNQANIKELIVYETVTNYEIKSKLINSLKENFDFFAFTSPSNIKSFLELSGEKGRKILQESKIIPIGHVTAQALKKYNLSPWKIPKEYTIKGIIDTLTQHPEEEKNDNR